QEAFAGELFGDSPLGRPILGTVASINALSRTAINGWYRRRYVAPNIVVAAAGNLTHREVVRAVTKAFRAANALGPAGGVPARPPPRPRRPAPRLGPARPHRPAPAAVRRPGPRGRRGRDFGTPRGGARGAQAPPGGHPRGPGGWPARRGAPGCAARRARHPP